MKKLLLLFFILFFIGLVSAQSEGEQCSFIGLIQNDFYCGTDFQWHAQKDSGSCSNDFECSANSCLDGQCQTGGAVEEVIKQHNLIQDILNWLKGEGWADLGDNCIEDVNCEDPYHCDPTSHTCVVCYQNNHCESGEICDLTTNTCEIGEPHPGCQSDNDCESGVCDLSTGNCVACLEDNHCGEGFVCVNYICEPEPASGCESDLDCQPGTVCHFLTGNCVACLEDNHCGEGFVCIGFICEPDNGGCQSDNDCESGVCDLSTGNCVACLIDNDCGEGFICIDYICEPEPASGCIQDSDCQPGTVCHTSTGNCVACLEDNHCGEGFVCIGFICEPETNGNGGTPSTGGPSGGGGSSWGGSSGYIWTKYITLHEDRLESFGVSHNLIPVIRFSTESDKEYKNQRFKIRYLTEKPPALPTPKTLVRGQVIPEPNNLVYIYFQIEPDEIEDVNLEDVTLEFKVQKSWLNTNKRKESSIKLLRYTSQWNTLPTTRLQSDINYAKYRAISPGFSYFAIVSALQPGEKYTPPIQTMIPPTPQPECGDGFADINENCENCPQDIPCADNEVCKDQVCKKKTSLLWLWILISLIVIGGAVYFVFLRKR